MGGSPSTYKVLSIPAHTGKVRPTASAFPESALKELKESEAHKSLLELFQLPGSDAYKTNQYQFNWDSVGAPLAFFLPKTEEDIGGFFRYYNSQTDLQKYSISVAAGRHSNLATITDALVIDMKNFIKTDINTEEKVGHFGAGLKLGEFDEACRAKGLATTAGTNPDTGICGLILGGGFGYLARRHGLASDNMIGARVVLPSGEIVSATESNEHKDLLWGLRGGGGDFGVVTEMTLRLYTQGDVYSGVCVYVMRQPGIFTIGHRAIMQQWREFAAKAPNEVGCMLIMPANGPLVLMYQFSGPDLAEGERLLVDAKKIGNPLIKSFSVIPYSGGPKSLQWAALKGQQPGNYYECGLILRELADGAVDVLLKYTSAPTVPNKKCTLVLAQLGGKIDEYGADHSPFSGRKAVFWIIVLGNWESCDDAAEYNRRRAAVKHWLLSLKTELTPWLVEGTYNTLSSEEAEQKEKEVAEGKAKAEEEQKDGDKLSAKANKDYLFETPLHSGTVRKRLVELKRKYDPKNLLRNNKNIDPNEPL